MSDVLFTVDTFLYQNQLSAVEEEFNVIAGSEMEALKQTIADKDREIAEFSGELQTLEAQLQEVDKYPSEEKEEEVNRLVVVTSELRAKLVEAKGEKQERERQLDAIHQQMEHLQHLIVDLREKKCATSQVDRCVATLCVEFLNLHFLTTNFLSNLVLQSKLEVVMALCLFPS